MSDSRTTKKFGSMTPAERAAMIKDGAKSGKPPFP
jgi:hypothetical protein